MTGHVVTDADLAAYRADGAVCLRRVLDDRWIATLDRGVDRNIAHPGPLHADFTASGGDGRCIKDDFCWTWIPEYEGFARRSPCGALAGRLMDARAVRFFEDQYFQKEAGAATPTPWHQDQPYYAIAGTWCVTWIPLDPVDEADSLRIVAGSHASGALYMPRSFSETGGAYATDAAAPLLPPVPDIDAEPGRHRILAWAMEPGDCIVFHPRALHGNAGNRSPHRARRLSMRWVAEDTVYDKGGLPWAELLPDGNPALGAPLTGPLFPLVWTSEQGLIAEMAPA